MHNASVLKYTQLKSMRIKANIRWRLAQLDTTQLAGLSFLLALTIWGSWTLAKVFISDWLRLASSCSRESFCCSITLLSSSIDFMLDSIVVIWSEETGHGLNKTWRFYPTAEYAYTMPLCVLCCENGIGVCKCTSSWMYNLNMTFCIFRHVLPVS